MAAIKQEKRNQRVASVNALYILKTGCCLPRARSHHLNPNPNPLTTQTTTITITTIQRGDERMTELLMAIAEINSRNTEFQMIKF